MKLNIKTFFSTLILKPWEADTPKEQNLAWAATIILGVATVGAFHAGYALGKYVILPLLEKTGLPGKIDELKKHYFPENPVGLEDSLKKNEGDTPTKGGRVGEIGRALEKASGVTQERKPAKLPVQAGPQIKTPNKKRPPPLLQFPQDWERTERNLRASSHKDDKFAVELIDKMEFQEACISIAKEFSRDPSQNFKEKMGAYVNAWNALMNNEEALPKVHKSDSFKASAHIAFWMVLKKNLSEENFIAFQQAFTKDYPWDKENDAHEMACQMYSTYGLINLRCFEQNPPPD